MERYFSTDKSTNFAKYSPRKRIMSVSRRKKLFSQPQTWFIPSFNLRQVFKKRSWIISFVEWEKCGFFLSEKFTFRYFWIGTIFWDWNDEFDVTIRGLAREEKWPAILTCSNFAAIRQTLHFSKETRYLYEINRGKSMPVKRHMTGS